MDPDSKILALPAPRLRRDLRAIVQGDFGAGAIDSMFRAASIAPARTIAEVATLAPQPRLGVFRWSLRPDGQPEEDEHPPCGDASQL